MNINIYFFLLKEIILIKKITQGNNANMNTSGFIASLSDCKGGKKFIMIKILKIFVFSTQSCFMRLYTPSNPNKISRLFANWMAKLMSSCNVFGLTYCEKKFKIIDTNA